MQPIGNDGKIILTPHFSFYTAQVLATDSTGAAFTNFFTYFYSSNPNIAVIDKFNGKILSMRQSHVTLYAQTWSYGVAALDSLPLEVTGFQDGGVTVLAQIPTGSNKPVLTFWPQIVTVQVGGSVTWDNQSYTDSIDVVFDDPTNVDSIVRGSFGFATGSGNIPTWAYDTLGTGTDSIANLIVAWDKTVAYVCPTGNGIYGQGKCGIRDRLFPVAGVYHYHSTKQHTSGTIIVQ
jgi:plastocyanin